MKLKFARELQHDVKKKLRPVYLISGDDIIQKDEAIQVIMNAAKQQGYSGYHAININKQTSDDELTPHLQTLSLFHDKKCIRLRFDDSAPNKVITALLSRLDVNLLADTLLILDLPKLDQKAQKSDWFTHLETLGAHLAIWPLSSAQMPYWIKDRTASMGLSLTTDTVRLITSLFDTNTLLISQLLDKMSLCGNVTNWSDTRLRQIANDEPSTDIYELADAFMANDRQRARLTLMKLQAAGIEPILIIWALEREITIYLLLYEAAQKHESPNAIYKNYQLFPTRQAVINPRLNQINVTGLQQTLIRLFNIDQMIKGQLTFNPWHALEWICLA